MKTAVILAAGEGTRVWPYAETRPKAMIPVANKPLIEHNVDTLRELGFEKIVVAAGDSSSQISNHFRNTATVQIVATGPSDGPARTLARVTENVVGDDFLVLYGDTIVAGADLTRLMDLRKESGNHAAALVSDLEGEKPGNWICCSVENGLVSGIMGHPRDGFDRKFAAFAFSRGFLPYVENNSGIFTQVQVGVMPPKEAYIEMSLVDYLKDGNRLPAVETRGVFFDIDKPWGPERYGW